MGAYLHAETGVPVIGVAKTLFRTATHAVPVPRGTSVKPLYITAAGVAPDRAVAMVAGMAGAHRTPHALRRLDTLTRTPHPNEWAENLPGKDHPRQTATVQPPSR